MIWQEIGDVKSFRVMCVYIDFYYIGRFIKELGVDGFLIDVLQGNKDLFM